MPDLLDELFALELKRRDAWLARDRDALAALLDDDFAELNAFGRLARSQLLGAFFDRLRLLEFTAEAPRLHGTAASPILSYTCFERLTVDGAPFEGRCVVASHYVDRGTGWRILLWQITPLVDAAASR